MEECAGSWTMTEFTFGSYKKKLSNIRKLEYKSANFDKNYWGKDGAEDEDVEEDKDEKQVKEQWQKLMQKAKQKAGRMIKIMGDVAVDIGIPHYTEIIQGSPYDIEKGSVHRRRAETRFYAKKEEHLSDAQLKLSQFALAHPSPEKL